MSRPNRPSKLSLKSSKFFILCPAPWNSPEKSLIGAKPCHSSSLSGATMSAVKRYFASNAQPSTPTLVKSSKDFTSYSLASFNTRSQAACTAKGNTNSNGNKFFIVILHIKFASKCNYFAKVVGACGTMRRTNRTKPQSAYA